MKAGHAQRVAGTLLALAIGASIGWCLVELCDPESAYAPRFTSSGERA